MIVGTHQRDYDLYQIYKTTKVYVMRILKIPCIVADREWFNKGKYSGKGDC